MSSILLSTAFTAGDVLPFARIGRCLQRRGHRVTLITNEHYRDVAHAHGCEFAPTDSAEAYATFLQDSALFNSPGGIATLYERHVLPAVEREYQAIAEACVAGDTLLVARCAPAIAARMAAIDFGIPLALAFLSPHNLTTGALLDELLKGVLAPQIAALCEAAGRSWPRYRDRWDRAAIDGVCLWPEWFAPTVAGGSYSCTGFVVGPTAPPARPLRDDAPILVTAGTGAFFDARFFEMATAACAAIGRHCIAVTTDRRVATRLPPGVTWIEQIPFHLAFLEVAAVVHHGGIGTAAQALAAGVPQMIIGAGGDRPDNAGRLVTLGVAEYVPPAAWSIDALATALRRLLLSPDVRARCGTMATHVNGGDAAEDAAAWCERLVDTPSPRYVVPVSTPPRATAIGAESPQLERLKALSSERLVLLHRRLGGKATPSAQSPHVPTIAPGPHRR